MAIFQCLQCEHEGHFTEFVVGTNVTAEDFEDGDINDDYDPDLECPECGSSSVYET